MCNPASMVLTRTHCYWSKKTDSHEEIISEFGIVMDNARGVSGVRVEISPRNNDFTLPLKDWAFHVDQDILPDWWNALDGETRTRHALENWAKARLVRAGETLNTLSGDTNIVALLEGGTINCVQGGTIKYVYGGTINCVQGGTINCVQGGTIDCVEGGTIDCVKGGTINCVQGGTIKYVYGGTIDCVEGGTIDCVKGGTIKYVYGGTIDCVKGGTINCVQGGTINCVQGGLVCWHTADKTKIQGIQTVCLDYTGAKPRMVLGTKNPRTVKFGPTAKSRK